jgi:protein O-mannosyl-transferase
MLKWRLSVKASQKPRRPLRANQPAPPHDIASGRLNPSWRAHGRRVFLIWIVLFAAYSNSFRTELTLDNALMIADDPRIRSATPDNLRQILTEGYWHASADSGLYRPLTTLSYLLNHAVLGNGSRPFGYHLVNLILHGINVALVYALGILIFGESAPAWAVAALWGLHPVLTESVTNIVGRADLLSVMGVLIGFLCYVKSISAKGWQRAAWIVGLVTAQAAGLFSKESAAVLPGIMLLYDLTWSQRATWPKRFRAYCVLAVPCVVFLYLRNELQTSMRIGFGDNPLVSAGFP